MGLNQNNVQRSAKRRGCLLSYSQAEPERELTQPRKHLLAEPCTRKIATPFPLPSVPNEFCFPEFLENVALILQIYSERATWLGLVSSHPEELAIQITEPLAKECTA